MDYLPATLRWDENVWSEVRTSTELSQTRLLRPEYSSSRWIPQENHGSYGPALPLYFDGCSTNAYPTFEGHGLLF